MDFTDIKIIVSEVDGVLTDGSVYRDELSNPVFKKYYSLDFEAINELKREYTVVFLSSDNAISYNLLRNKQLPFYHTKHSRKNVLYEILNRYATTAPELLYIGATYSDIDCMKLAQISTCSIDSPLDVQGTADFIINKPAGTGIFSYVYDYIARNKLIV